MSVDDIVCLGSVFTKSNSTLPPLNPVQRGIREYANDDER